jgi:hypothetical protein
MTNPFLQVTSSHEIKTICADAKETARIQRYMREQRLDHKRIPDGCATATRTRLVNLRRGSLIFTGVLISILL